MAWLCRILEISRSGYYAWLKRRPGIRQQRNQELARELVTLHQKYPAFGLDSLYHILKPVFHCSRKRVHRLMKKLHIHSIRKTAYKATTNSNHTNPVAPNLLQRQFTFSEINKAWVGDITYIRTDEGWLYLAMVKDLCSKKIVGYAFSDRINTQLTLDALNMAVRREKPGEGLIFHSDRGVQYASNDYRDRLKQLKIQQSMSRKGDPYDNAVAENFFSCLKCELVCLRHYTTREAAKADIFLYIESFYNMIRPHSGIGWMAPCAFEQQLLHSDK